MPLNPNKWVIDEANSDDEYLYIEVVGYGAVQIKRESEGIVVDIFASDPEIKDSPVASTYAFLNELTNEEV